MAAASPLTFQRSTPPVSRTPPKDDTWAMQPIGAPFPDGPVRVPQHQNMYVALWYKHGKPVHGRAWNEGGGVQCSIPYKNVELKGEKELEGQIQVLTYKGDYDSLGFWYEWLPYKKKFDNDSFRELVRCGNSVPILMKCADTHFRMGYLDLSTEIACVSYDGKVDSVEGPALKDFIVPFRNTKMPASMKIFEDQWVDLRFNDLFPANAYVANSRPLNTETGPMKQHIALWYKHGVPLFGRAYPSTGNKLWAHFGKNNVESFGPEVGSMQVLVLPEARLMGYEYQWMPLLEGKSLGWTPLHIANSAPVIMKEENGVETLGNLDMATMIASCGWAGKEKVIKDAAAVAKLKVMFRRKKPE